MTDKYLPSHFSDADRTAKVAALQSYDKADQMVTSYAIQQRLAKEPVTPRMLTGLPSLDRLTEGVGAGEVVVVAGHPKHGKSLLMQTITHNLARQEIHAAWFSYELTNRQFLSRFPDLPYFAMPQYLAERAMPWLSDRIWEGKLKFGIRHVFIDHLHYLVDLAKAHNASLEIGAIMRALVRIAIEHEVVIWLAAHVTKRSKEQSADTPPTDADLRDSSLIGGEASTVLTVHRKRLSPNLPDMSEDATVTVCLCRQTGAMYKSFVVTKRGGWLAEGG